MSAVGSGGYACAKNRSPMATSHTVSSRTSRTSPPDGLPGLDDAARKAVVNEPGVVDLDEQDRAVALNYRLGTNGVRARHVPRIRNPGHSGKRTRIVVTTPGGQNLAGVRSAPFISPDH